MQYVAGIYNDVDGNEVYISNCGFAYNLDTKEYVTDDKNQPYPVSILEYVRMRDVKPSDFTVIGDYHKEHTSYAISGKMRRKVNPILKGSKQYVGSPSSTGLHCMVCLDEVEMTNSTLGIILDDKVKMDVRKEGTILSSTLGVIPTLAIESRVFQPSRKGRVCESCKHLLDEVIPDSDFRDKDRPSDHPTWLKREQPLRSRLYANPSLKGERKPYVEPEHRKQSEPVVVQHVHPSMVPIRLDARPKSKVKGGKIDMTGAEMMGIPLVSALGHHKSVVED